MKFTINIRISGISLNDQDTFLELFRTELVAHRHLKLVNIEPNERDHSYTVTIRRESIDDLTAKLLVQEEIEELMEGITTDSDFKVEVLGLHPFSQ